MLDSTFGELLLITQMIRFFDFMIIDIIKLKPSMWTDMNESKTSPFKYY